MSQNYEGLMRSEANGCSLQTPEIKSISVILENVSLQEMCGSITWANN